MLACVLGRRGEVFFPKLNEEQMLTFSAICDDFLAAHEMDKDLCDTDEEAKLKAAALKHGEGFKYPTVYFNSDTTGEKAYEEFFVPSEKIDMQRFESLGVIEQSVRHDMQEVDRFFEQLEAIFLKPDFTKEQVIDAIRAFIPTFKHKEKGKNLDQKM